MMIDMLPDYPTLPMRGYWNGRRDGRRYHGRSAFDNRDSSTIVEAYILDDIKTENQTMDVA